MKNTLKLINNKAKKKRQLLPEKLDKLLKKADIFKGPPEKKLKELKKTLEVFITVDGIINKKE